MAVKVCRVCGVEGRALCFPCQGKISAASPRKQRALKKMHADPKFKAAQVERMKKMNADPEFKAALIKRTKKMNADPKFKAASIERAKKMNADPKFKVAQSERSKEMQANPKFKAALSERMKKMNADPKFKAASIERAKKMNADPEFKATQSERAKKTQADPKFKAALSERMKKMNADPEFKATQSERAKKTQAEHPEIRILNGYGKTTTVDGHLFPSKAEAGVWSKLKKLGGEPVYGETLAPILTPYGNTFPDTMLGVSVLDIPAGVPIEIKDGDGSWEWSKAQVWAVRNGETFLVCVEDLAPVTAALNLVTMSSTETRPPRCPSGHCEPGP